VPVPGGALTAPMPGRLVAFAVRVGDAVVPGQPLAVLDAMKMEHTIAAPFAGTVAELLFAPASRWRKAWRCCGCNKDAVNPHPYYSGCYTNK